MFPEIQFQVHLAFLADQSVPLVQLLLALQLVQSDLLVLLPPVDQLIQLVPLRQLLLVHQLVLLDLLVLSVLLNLLVLVRQ
jgi:hypothetical protein